MNLNAASALLAGMAMLLSGPSCFSPELDVTPSATSEDNTESSATETVDGSTDDGEAPNEAMRADRIEIYSGDAQNATTLTEITSPLVVLVRNRDGNPVANSALEWQVIEGDATLGEVSSETDSNGRGGALIAFGPTAGTVLVSTEVEGTDLSVVFALSALTPAQTLFSNQVVTFPVLPVGGSQAQTLSITNTGQSHATEFYLSVDGAGFSLANNTCGEAGSAISLASSDSCTFDVVFSPLASATSLGSVSVSYFDGSQSQNSQPVVLSGRTYDSISIASGNNLAQTRGSQLAEPFVTLVMDSSGNPVVGATVDWAVTSGGGSLSAESTLTAADGLATVILTLGSDPGVNTVSATIHDTAILTQFTATSLTTALLAMSEENYGFSVQALNSSTSRTITLSNSGQIAATNTYIGLTGTGFSLADNACGTSGAKVLIPAGETCTFDVIYNPTQTQAHAATVNLSYFDGISTQVTPSLSLTGEVYGSIAVASGNNQSKTVGLELDLPFVAVVKNSSNQVLENVTVNWVVSAGGGSLALATGMTDENGLASTTLTLGTTSGVNSVSATINGTLVSTSFSATALTPADLIASASSHNFGVTALNSPSTQSFIFTNSGQSSATDVFVSLPDAGFSFLNNFCGTSGAKITLGPSASCGFDVTYTPTLTQAYAGTVSLSYYDGSTTQTGTAISLAGETFGSISIVSGDDQTATAGTTLANPFVIVVHNSSNAIVQGAEIAWSNTQNGGTLSTDSGTTNASGQAQTSLTLGAAGEETVSAAIVGTELSAAFSATALTPASLGFSAASYDFEIVIVGQSPSESFTLTNSGQSQATAVYVTASGSGYSLANNTCGANGSPVIIAGGANCTFDVVFAPSVSGSSNGTVSLSYHNGATTQTTPSVNLTGMGCGGANPEVCSVNIAANATGVNPSTSLQITFSHEMNTATFTRDTVFLQDTLTSRYIEGTTSYDSGTDVLTFAPIMAMDTKTNYTLTLTAGVGESLGTPLATNFTRAFTTGDVMISGVGFSTTSGTLTIYGTCSPNASGLSATLDGQAVTLDDSDCSTNDNGVWSEALTPSNGSHTLVVNASSSTSSDTTSVTIPITRCASLDAIVAVDYDADDSGGDDQAGTAGDPILITSIGHVKYLTDNIATYKTKSFKLMNGLDFSCKTYVPIGNSTDNFTGTFDGNGHVFKNVSIEAAGSIQQGPFGVVGTAGVIKNLGILNGYVVSNGNTGGVIGKLDAGEVKSVFFTGYLYSSAAGSNIGGIVGEGFNAYQILDSYSAGTIKASSTTAVGGVLGYAGSAYNFMVNSYSYMYVNGSTRVGGVLGQALGGAYVQNFAMGPVAAAGNDAGGFVGNMSGTWTAYYVNSYARGSVSGNTNIGGFIGNETYNYGAIINSYASGTATGTSAVHPLYGNLTGTYFKVFNSFFKDTACGTAPPTGCPGTKGGVGLSEANLKLLSTYNNAGWEFGQSAISEWAKEGADHYPKATLNYCSRGLSDLTSAANFAGGTGDPGDPYLISNASQLNKIRDFMTSSFRLTNDIDMGCYRWNPVGTSGTPFQGTIDGNGFAIDGVFVTVRPEATAGTNVGFIGYSASNGSISNLTFYSRVSGYEYVGGVLGYSTRALTSVSINARVYTPFRWAGIESGRHDGATLSQVTTSGLAIAGSGCNMGGITGYGGNLTINDSSSSGFVAGFGCVRSGGFIGWSSGATINRSYFTGTAYNYDKAGGLVGDASSVTINNSYSLGTIIAGHDIAGGLVGYSSTTNVTDSFAAGTVIAPTNANGLIGSYISGTITTSYALDTDCVTAPPTGCAEPSGAKGYADEYLIQQSTFTGFDFDTIWLMPENDYPDLQ